MPHSLRLSLCAASAVAAMIFTATNALAEHDGPGSIHVRSGIEFGPRLSTRLQTPVPQADKIPSAATTSTVTADSVPPAPVPKRNVRVVYPGPHTAPR